MIIRNEQIEAMKPMEDDILYRKIYAHIRSDPEQDTSHLNEKELMSMIKTGVQKGREYELTWVSSLTAFVSLTILIAPNFDQYPPAQQILTDERIEENERPLALVNELTEEDWGIASSYK